MMAGRGGSSLVYGKIQLHGDASLEEMKKILGDILKEYKYPESSDDAAHVKDAVQAALYQKKEEEELKEAQEMLKELTGDNDSKRKKPWEKK